jgi:Tfp pilus assembly protein PilO
MPRLVITIILLFGAVVVGSFYLLPEWRNFREFRGEAQELREISAELDLLTENRDELLSRINSISKDDLRRIDQALPTGPQSAEFLVLLEKLASKNNLALRRVDLVSAAALGATVSGGQPRPGGSPTKSIKNGGIAEFPVGISLGGSYEAFKGFLSDLEQNLRTIDVTDISFTSPEKINTFDFGIKAKTYYQ